MIGHGLRTMDRRRPIDRIPAYFLIDGGGLARSHAGPRASTRAKGVLVFWQQRRETNRLHQELCGMAGAAGASIMHLPRLELF